MVYLVGIDHLIQYNNYIVPEYLFIEFNNYLIKKALELNIELLAEEFSEESLYKVYNAAEATVKKAADKIGIEHRFCDPEEPDRKRIGIPYFADIKDNIERKYGVSGKIVLDYNLVEKIKEETIENAKAFWYLREIFWYNKISDSIFKNIIFVCGHEHVYRFKSLMESKGCDCDIINDFWMRDIFSDYQNLNL